MKKKYGEQQHHIRAIIIIQAQLLRIIVENYSTFILSYYVFDFWSVRLAG